MRALLDTHIFLWWITDDPRLSDAIRSSLGNPRNELWLSAASGWEIGIKYRLGRLPLPRPPAEYIPEHLRHSGIRWLAMEAPHAFQAAALPLHHRDPVDRMLVAQAQLEDLVLLSADQALRTYSVETVG